MNPTVENKPAFARVSTGIAELDRMLGGGLLPGTLTVVMGATGIGKTQLGLQFAAAGKTQEGQTGIVFDMTSRGDGQNHVEYARRMFDWNMKQRQIDEPYLESGADTLGLLSYLRTIRPTCLDSGSWPRPMARVEDRAEPKAGPGNRLFLRKFRAWRPSLCD
jgi:replicative DNA helicase